LKLTALRGGCGDWSESGNRPSGRFRPPARWLVRWGV